MGTGSIDIALWDLAGKRLGISVSQLLGGSLHAPAYLRRPTTADGGGLRQPEAFADFAEECYALGYRGFKIHGWHDGGRSARRKLFASSASASADAWPSCTIRPASFAPSPTRCRSAAPAMRPAFSGTRTLSRQRRLAAHSHRRLREMIKTPLLLGEHVRGLESNATFVVLDGTDSSAPTPISTSASPAP